MRTPRIYLDTALSVGTHVSLDARAHQHLSRVLRLAAGARITLFNGRGGEYLATLAEIDRKAASARIDSFDPTERESTLQVHLLQAIVKGKRMDFAVQKAVELGVASIQPVLARYTAGERGATRMRAKLAHWTGVIVSACEQSGRTRVPELRAPLALRETLSLEPQAIGLVPDLKAADALPAGQPRPASVTLLIGPEGGLSDDELALAVQAGFTRVRLGPRTLRSESAAAAGVTLAQYLWGDLG